MLQSEVHSWRYRLFLPEESSLCRPARESRFPILMETHGLTDAPLQRARWLKGGSSCKDAGKDRKEWRNAALSHSTPALEAQISPRTTMNLQRRPACRHHTAVWEMPA